MKPVDELFSIVFGYFSINASTGSVFVMTATLETIKLFNDLRAVSKDFPWLSDWFAVNDGPEAKHTAVKGNRLKLKVFNKLNDLGELPIFAVSRPFNGYKVIIFLRTASDSLEVAP